MSSCSWTQQAASDPRAAAVLKRYHWRPREELYDVRLDPFEVHNLADDPDFIDIKQKLGKQLTA